MSLFQFYFIEFTAIYILLGWALYLPFRANQLYFGGLYSMCLGGYFAAYTSVNLGWPVGLVIIGAVAFSVLFSVIPALKLADLGGFPMMIATMALLFIVTTAARNFDFLGGRHGLFGVPVLSQTMMLSLTAGLLLLVGFLVYRIDNSHIGRAMDAVKLDRDVAGTLGIDVNRLSVFLQLVSAAIGGLAGVLYVYTLGSIFPEAFGPSMILYAIAIVTFGGMQTMWGAILASPILWGLSQTLPEAYKHLSVIAYAVLLIAVLLIRPSGLIDRKMLRAITKRQKKQAPETITHQKGEQTC